MTAVKGPADRHVAALLDLALRRLKAELEPDSARWGLRGSHLRVLTLMPTDGVRAADLARTAAMTKQSLGELVAVLLERGLVVRDPDPADRRAHVLRRTADGDRAVREGLEAIAALERRWSAEVGERRWRTTVAVLSALTDPERSPGAPGP
jgi:DNA-binding MarR family transcriptional regulator